jgi:hypothetical protein
MKNRNLMQDVVKTYGEESQLDNIIDSSLKLAMAVREYKKFKNDKLQYAEVYNEVCERIADVKLMMESAEFLFNGNSINEHYNNKIHYLKESLK